MTTIALHSDLHLDFQSLHEGWLIDTPDILVLAGDIIRIDKVADFLIGLSDSYPNMFEAEKALREALIVHDKFHFLQCDTVELKGYGLECADSYDVHKVIKI